MKQLSFTIVLISMLLASCGGSGSDSTSTPTVNDPVASLSSTVWKKECVPHRDIGSDDSHTLWNANVNLTIDASMKSTYKTEFFHPTDTECNVMMFDTLHISSFEIAGKVMSEESVEAFRLNETFTYSSAKEMPAENYTLIYIDSERLYFGQNSGDNLGKTPETRHSSISLDEYFSQIVN